jgi:2,3-bisphosphoglycerate-independent phosphoglycerate mutase
MATGYKKVALLVLDGFGVASRSRGNAVTLSDPQNLNQILANFPAVTLQASGPLVGLPWGEMGNSEVGHLNIGAGRIVSQDLPRITASIQSGEFFHNPAFIKACQHVKENNSSLHLLGMVSAGGVHSYDEHLYALLGLAAEQGIEKVFIHMITDGRDTDEKVALLEIEKLHSRISQIGVGKIATVAGRFYAMDRGGHWNQTEMMYQAMVNSVGEYSSSALDAIATNYAKGVFDEMILPTVITESGEPIAKVSKNDSIIFFNFRQDRALQLTVAFVDPERMLVTPPHPKIENLLFVTMTSYSPQLKVEVAFLQLEIINDIASIVSAAGIKQFHAAESEKFAHVTSFFNGGKMDPLVGEERMIVSSPDNTNNYMDHPEMSVEKLTDSLVEKITKSDIGFFVANFANADMVGHTGNLVAATNAIKAIDQQLKRLVDAVLSVNGVLAITADHGNAEMMLNSNGEIDKDHTTSPVPFILIGNDFKRAASAKITYDTMASLMPEGALSDIAPTLLELIGLPQPPEMSGISLLSVLKNQINSDPIKQP